MSTPKTKSPATTTTTTAPATPPPAPPAPTPTPAPSPTPDPNVALAAYVQQTVATLDGVEAQLGSDPPLTPKDKRHAAKMRKGGANAVSTIGNLATQNQLESPALQVAAMMTLLGKAQALQPLVDRLAEFVKHVGDLIFSAQSQSWEMAMQYYALLQRRAVADAELAKSLQPVAQFFAYRHPSVKKPVGSPTTKQVNAAKKAKRTLAKVAGGKLADISVPTAGSHAAPPPAPAPAGAPASSSASSAPATGGNGAPPTGAPPVTNGGSTPTAHS
jgi:hypothetical protein